MWKLVLGFIVFAVVMIVILKQSGGSVDMGGEKHGVEADTAASAASAAASR